ncbi:histone H1.0-like [Hydractinia symbiolongicarpus]|uniref:histone H1.0-like n=1 Tax=Hydractinia symbiolongicarpus TaxID=13093 RepID=UPI00255032D1|nr:histone H1.0-like [Hydractinia symbiolongicarpus]
MLRWCALHYPVTVGKAYHFPIFTTVPTYNESQRSKNQGCLISSERAYLASGCGQYRRSHYQGNYRFFYKNAFNYLVNLLQYIHANYKVAENSDHYLKLALKREVTFGQLVQAEGTDASGSFKQGKVKNKKLKKSCCKKCNGKKPTTYKNTIKRKPAKKSTPKKAPEKPYKKKIFAKKPAAKKPSKEGNLKQKRSKSLPNSDQRGLRGNKLCGQKFSENSVTLSRVAFTHYLTTVIGCEKIHLGRLAKEKLANILMDI